MSAVSTAEARTIAADWHGGQFTALYSIASSGRIDCRSKARNEIDNELKTKVDDRERARLLRLRAWVDACRQGCLPQTCVCC